jgi:fructokinase
VNDLRPTPDGPRVVVVGEALVDLVPTGGTLLPLPAGSPVNVAVGLGRLEVPTAFLGTLSKDGFGGLLVDRLRDAAVTVDLAPRVDAPTTLAVVHLDAERRATYGFYLDGTSAADLDEGHLPALPPGAAVHVSFGAIGPLHDPAGVALLTLLRRAGTDHLVSLDPNVRAVTDEDRDRTVAALEDAVSGCHLVKVSDEDLATLYPGRPTDAVLERWATSGPALVVVTRGPDGATAVGTTAGRVDAPGRRVEVVDTVGAGDAFTSGLLAHLDGTGHLDVATLGDLDTAGLEAALTSATHVAAVTCGREGADPPTRVELDT